MTKLQPSDKSVWQRLDRLLATTEQDDTLARQLLAEVQTRCYAGRTCRALLSMPNCAVARFYALLAATRAVVSPVHDYSDSRWMADADFCFVNIAATGLEERPGTLLQAAKLLPGIRASALHLAPLTVHEFDVKYAVRSVRSIDRRITDTALAAEGFGAEDQMCAFIEAAHLLGKVVGFDLEPHTAQFSIPVLLHPELFRWLKLTRDRGLDYGLTEDGMLAEANQVRLSAEVSEIVRRELTNEGLSGLEHTPDDSLVQLDCKDRVFSHLVHELIRMGYWTIPSQWWGGTGVPSYDGYDYQGNYARFRYVSADGADRSSHAFHILTPYKYYTGLQANRAPDAAHVPATCEPGIRAYCEVFAPWRDEFGFDFVRYDSVDHIFDSIWDGSELPTSDRPTPVVLRTCIQASRDGNRPYIGSFAERMGEEIDEYASLGFDVMLGADVLQHIDRQLIERNLSLHDRLFTHNLGRACRSTVAFAVDTHDSGGPHIWGQSLTKISKFKGMRLRHFISRFISAGPARRPKYEVMGAQDLSYGLYESNTLNCNLVWVGDEAYNQSYHLLEDIYEQFRTFLTLAKITERQVTDCYGWWALRYGCECLIATASLEAEDCQSQEIRILIDLELLGCSEHPEATLHDFTSREGLPLTPVPSCMEIQLPYLGFALIHFAPRNHDGGR